MLDWKTGRPNAKYFSVQMLAAAFGTGNETVVGVQKTLYPSTTTTAIYVLPYRRADDGSRRLLIASKLSVPIDLTVTGGFCAGDSGKARVLEAAEGAAQPGFDTPVDRALSKGQIRLGVYALATVVCD